MKKEDLRVKRTKKVLRDNLILLLNDKELNNITIKDLCTRSNINRRTFYLHYSSLDDVLSDIKYCFTMDFIDKVRDYNDIKLFIREYFLFCLEKNNLAKNLIINIDLSLINYNNSYYNKIILCYINSSLMGIYNEWIINKEISLDEIIDFSYNIISNGIKNIKIQE